MNDNLEKFIKSHRTELDDKSPRKDLWNDIEKEINPKRISRNDSGTLFYWKAAAVILLLISSWLAFEKVYSPPNETQVAELSEVNPEFQEAETFYVSLINQKREDIEILSKEYDMEESFANETDRLDSVYLVLKQDLNQGNEEEIADAMILNLQLRIEILNQQLSIIQSIKNSQKDEKTSL